MIADYRSDTVTRPGKDMLSFMMKAPVGDDVFAEDPSINHLELLAARIFGYEAAIFCQTYRLDRHEFVGVNKLDDFAIGRLTKIPGLPLRAEDPRCA